MSNSPNINMPIPIPTVTPGPEYASDLAQSLNLLDAHDHTSGKGLKITPAAININMDLDFANHRPINLPDLPLTNLSLDAPNNNSVYFKNGELFAKDSVGNTVQITNNGSISGATGSISGLVSPASASYSSITKSFTFNFDSGKPAGLNIADVRLYPYDGTTQYTNFITLTSPTTLTGQYSITFPDALVATSGKRLVQMDESGLVSQTPATLNLVTGKHILQMDEVGNVTEAYTTFPSVPRVAVVSTDSTGNLDVIKSFNSTFNRFLLIADQDGNVDTQLSFTFPTSPNAGKQYALGIEAGTGQQVLMENDYGMVPIGAIIPIASHLVGSKNIPAPGTIVNGWMACTGAAIPMGYSLQGTTPALSSGVFLRGSNSSGTTGGTAFYNFADHKHNMDHVHQMSSAETVSVGGSGGFQTRIHMVTTAATSTFTFTNGEPITMSGLYGHYSVSGPDLGGGPNEALELNATDFQGTPAHPLIFTARPIDSSSVGKPLTDLAGGVAFDNQPPYMNVQFIIRCH